MAAGDTITGVNGSVTIPATIGVPQETVDIHIFEFTASVDQDIVDDSNFEGADNWKTTVGLMHHLTGTCRGTIMAGTGAELGIADFATVNAQPTAGFVLTADTGRTYTFAAIISNINVVVAKTDRCFCTLSFESSGDIEIA
jgi:hypothetical protein